MRHDENMQDLGSSAAETCKLRGGYCNKKKRNKRALDGEAD